MTTEPVLIPPKVPDPAPPVALLQGSFAIYSTPDGGIVLVWRKKGEERNRPLPVPAFILNMAAAQGGVSVDELLAKITAGDIG